MYKMDEILEMMKTFNTLDIHEIDMEHEGIKINMRKQDPVYISPRQNQHRVENKPVAIPTVPPIVTESKPVEVETKPEFITSVFVGTLAFKQGLQVGSYIKKGDLIASIDSLGIKHEIKSDLEGTIDQILVEEGQLIEYKEKLVSIKK